MRPSSFPEGMTINSNLHKNTTCPRGTVLIRRTTKNDLIHAKALQNHVKRHVTSYPSEKEKTSIGTGSHYAVMKTTIGEYYGASAKLIVYGFTNIKVEQSTISQIWILGGVAGPLDEVNAVQAGWHVDPSLYGDYLTHLSTFWTADGYDTGCYNLYCQGFMVISRDFSPGMEITQLSTYGGIQKSIDICIFKDPEEGNWWLTYGEERSLVGYWPKELFNNLEKPNEVDYGGAAYSPYNEPSPPMGSGHMPYEGPNKTCYFLNIKLVNKRNQLYSPKSNRVRLKSTRPDYYGIDGNYDSGYPDGYKFRYGGPGGYTRMKDV
ncbi:uncharacterized protein LOC109821447 [Asparagus officinalis]|uniref:uncharacterized protein LOC109821447 n=1 Tax=Asparagus officinalis TaxID=4686 RepID=UPI00098E0ABF|nr:uncharacterized protein LOC109821447 [Asparagus officinalis]